MLINSQADRRKLRLNPFVFPSDTDFRFVTLIVGVLGASLFIYSFLYENTPINILAFKSTNQKCMAAAQAAFSGSSIIDQQAANILFNKCMMPILLNEAVWICLGLALLLSVTAALYWILPNWKIWRGGLRTLNAGNTPSGMLAYLFDLCLEVELTSKPIFLLNPYNSAISGLTFGRFRRYYIVLNSGLAIQFNTDQPAFRAIILHELGHILNADIDKTYLSITVGWGFVIAALFPWVIAQCIPPWHFDQALAVGWRILALSVLIYLTRNAVLRTREVYADVRALVWDEHDATQGQVGALSRLLKAPLTSRGSHWSYLLRKHPDPQKRYGALNDTSLLFRVGFWDAFAVGVVATAAISGLSFLLGLLQVEISIGPNMEAVWAIVFTQLSALMIVGIIGSGVWRATFASLIAGKTIPRAVQASIALVLGLLLGQVLSLSSVATFDGEGLPYLLPGQLSQSSFADQSGFFLVWVVLLLIILFLLFGWIRTCASTWLRVALNGSRRGWIYWITIVIASIVLGVWFEQLAAIQGVTESALNRFDPLHSTSLNFIQALFGTTFPDIRISVTLADMYALAIDPLICIAFISLWAYPLVSWLFWRRKSRATHATWAWLGAVPTSQTPTLPYLARMRPGLALILGFVCGLTYCGLLILFASSFNLVYTNDDFIVLAILLQASVAAIVACCVEQMGVIHGLCAAFVAGCVMFADVVGFSVLHGYQLDPAFTWGIFGQIVDGGALVTLPVTLAISALAIQFRRLRRQAVDVRAA